MVESSEAIWLVRWWS